jgi:hypothetical protein
MVAGAVSVLLKNKILSVTSKAFINTKGVTFPTTLISLDLVSKGVQLIS